MGSSIVLKTGSKMFQCSSRAPYLVQIFIHEGWALRFSELAIICFLKCPPSFFYKNSRVRYSLLDFFQNIRKIGAGHYAQYKCVFCWTKNSPIFDWKKNDFKLFSMKKMVQICQILTEKNSKSPNFYDNFLQVTKNIKDFFFPTSICNNM